MVHNLLNHNHDKLFTIILQLLQALLEYCIIFSVIQDTCIKLLFALGQSGVVKNICSNYEMISQAKVTFTPPFSKTPEFFAHFAQYGKYACSCHLLLNSCNVELYSAIKLLTHFQEAICFPIAEKDEEKCQGKVSFQTKITFTI